MSRTWVIVAVAVGGALGALLRFGLSRGLQQQSATAFPIGTLAANLIGCLGIGFCYVWLESRGSPALRDGIRIGLIGALTTFSTYCIESIALLEKGAYGYALANLAGSVVLGLAACYLGIVLARSIFGFA